MGRGWVPGSTAFEPELAPAPPLPARPPAGLLLSALLRRQLQCTRPSLSTRSCISLHRGERCCVTARLLLRRQLTATALPCCTRDCPPLFTTRSVASKACVARLWACATTSTLVWGSCGSGVGEAGGRDRGRGTGGDQVGGWATRRRRLVPRQHAARLSSPASAAAPP